jgi:hypothetical protein
LSKGVPYRDIVLRTTSETMNMANRLGLNWSSDAEIGFVMKVLTGLLKSRCRAWVNDGTAPVWVDETLAEAWEEIAQSGANPLIVWRPDTGFYVRRTWTRANGNGRTAEHDELSDDEPESEAPAPRGERQPPEPTWPTPYSARPASAIPRRQWLYGRHYIRLAFSRQRL